MKEEIPPLPDRWSDSFQAFVKNCLERKPTRRLTANKALAHDFLAFGENPEEVNRLRQVWCQEFERIKRTVNAQKS